MVASGDLGLESIRDYIATDSVAYADLLVRRIVSSVERLAAFPESGRRVPEMDRSEIRELIVRPYRIVYRHRAGFVEIATVFHGARPFPGVPE